MAKMGNQAFNRLEKCPQCRTLNLYAWAAVMYAGEPPMPTRYYCRNQDCRYIKIDGRVVRK